MGMKMQVKTLYADMVTRCHDLMLGMLGAAQKGDVNGVRVYAERMAGQAGALAELLTMTIDE